MLEYESLPRSNRRRCAWSRCPHARFVWLAWQVARGPTKGVLRTSTSTRLAAGGSSIIRQLLLTGGSACSSSSLAVRVARGQYVLLLREGMKGYKPQNCGPEGWMTIVMAEYQVLPPLDDLGDARAALDLTLLDATPFET
jgi:hypothetical protein